MKKLLSVLTVLVVLFSFTNLTTSCSSEEEHSHSVIEKINERGHMLVGTSGKQFPFSFKDESGKLNGVDVHIAQKIAENMNVDIKFVEADLSDLVAMVKEGKVDIAISGLSITGERNMEVLFAGPYFTTGKSILSKDPKIEKGDAAYINNSDITIVTIENSSSYDFAKEHYPNAKIITANTVSACKEILYQEKADGLLADYELCEAFYFDSRNNGEYGFNRITGVNEQEYIGVAVSPEDQHFYNVIDNQIKRIRDGKRVEAAIESTWLQYLN